MRHAGRPFSRAIISQDVQSSFVHWDWIAFNNSHQYPCHPIPTNSPTSPRTIHSGARIAASGSPNKWPDLCLFREGRFSAPSGGGGESFRSSSISHTGEGGRGGGGTGTVVVDGDIAMGDVAGRFEPDTMTAFARVSCVESAAKDAGLEAGGFVPANDGKLLLPLLVALWWKGLWNVSRRRRTFVWANPGRSRSLCSDARDIPANDCASWAARIIWWIKYTLLKKQAKTTYATVAAKGFDIGLVDALDGCESRTKHSCIILVHTFLDEVRGFMLILLECREIKRRFINSAG